MNVAQAICQTTHEFNVAQALLWLEEMREPNKWDLSQKQTCELMGGVTRNTYRGWISKANSGEPFKIARDQLTRLSLMAGIHKALTISSPKGYEFDFFKRPNKHPMFGEQSAKELLLNDGDILLMFAVRNYFDAQRG